MRPFVRALAMSVLALALITTSALAHKGGDNDEQESGPPAKGAPEIDPGLVGGAAALLGGGLLILRNRRRA